MPTIADADEHPIIFNEWSINGILAGEKTQTRRLTGLEDVNEWPDPWTLKDCCQGTAVFSLNGDKGLIDPKRIDCPYGAPGDVLWVREPHYRGMSGHHTINGEWKSKWWRGGILDLSTPEPNDNNQ